MELVFSSDKLTTQDSRWISRIMAEFIQGLEALASLPPAVSVFGSTRITADDPDYGTAEQIGRLLAENRYAVMTGAGPGVMEAANKGVYEAGGVSVGLNIEIPHQQTPNRYLTKLVNFHHAFIRKAMFVKHSVAFVILPGGYGTLDELFESVMLIQTGKIKPFPVILVGGDYWDGLLTWLRVSVMEQGKIEAGELSIIKTAQSPEEVVQLITNASLPPPHAS